MAIEDSIDRTITELLHLRKQGYVGIDVSIREDGGDTFFSVYRSEDELPENKEDDALDRLKEKLRILREIERVYRVLKEFEESNPAYVPATLPKTVPYWFPWYTDDTSGTPYPYVELSFSNGEWHW